MSQETQIDKNFPNIFAVLKYLKDSGYKIGKSTLYNQKGMINREKDGTYSISAVEKYISLVGLERLDGNGKYSLDKIQEEKARVELEIAKEKRDNLQHKNKVAFGMYVPREAFERELVKRFIVFKSDLNNFALSAAERIIATTCGEPAKAPALIEYMQDAFADFLDRYAADREFKVPDPTAESILQDPDDDDDMGE